MKTARLVALALLLGAGVTFAVNTVPVDLPQLFRGGLWILPSSLNAQITNANKITRSLGSTPATTAWDFPVIGLNDLDTPCRVSGLMPMTGVKWGDTCDVQSDLGMDGGAAALPDTVLLTCKSKNNGAVVKLCALFTDAGTYDAADGGFWIRTFSNQ